MYSSDCSDNDDYYFSDNDDDWDVPVHWSIQREKEENQERQQKEREQKNKEEREQEREREREQERKYDDCYYPPYKDDNPWNDLRAEYFDTWDTFYNPLGKYEQELNDIVRELKPWLQSFNFKIFAEGVKNFSDSALTPNPLSTPNPLPTSITNVLYNSDLVRYIDDNFIRPSNLTPHAKFVVLFVLLIHEIDMLYNSFNSGKRDISKNFVRQNYELFQLAKKNRVFIIEQIKLNNATLLSKVKSKRGEFIENSELDVRIVRELTSNAKRYFDDFFNHGIDNLID
jgi:hypothetical protein